MGMPEELRWLVHARARDRCEYCLVAEMPTFAPHEIDHIIARKHSGPTAAENLALSCFLCNRHKGSDLTSIDPQTGEIVLLFHPRHDKWTDHFQLRGAEITPLTATGRATARMLQLNHPDRIEERELLLASGLYSAPTPSP